MVKSKSLALEAPIQFSQQGVSLPQGRTKAEGPSGPGSTVLPFQTQAPDCDKLILTSSNWSQ